MSKRFGFSMLVAMAVLTVAGTLGSVLQAGDSEILGGDAYPLDVCVVSGKPLGSMGAAFVLEHEGRTIKLCCKGCVPAFEKDAAAHLAKLDRAVVEKQAALYPLDVCVISGAKLGSMGGAVDHVVGNRLFRLCCKGCVPAVEKEAARHAAKLNAAVVEKQGSSYPLDTCVVSGQKLGSMGAPVSYVHHNRLVRFCCKGCVSAFEKDPGAYLAKLDSASPRAGSKSGSRDAGEER